jgi:hypothetical protein
MWVTHGHDDAADASSDDRIGARGCFALMAAWLQRDVERCTHAAGAGFNQGVDFSMVLAETLVPAFAHNLTVADDDSSYKRIGFDTSSASFGKDKSPFHPLGLGQIGHHSASGWKCLGNLHRLMHNRSR